MAGSDMDGRTNNEWALNAEDAVKLTEAGIRALAERLVALQVAQGGWLEWEDVPMLSEATFLAVAEEVDRCGARLVRALRDHDRSSDIDSAYLLEIAQDGPRTEAKA